MFTKRDLDELARAIAASAKASLTAHPAMRQLHLSSALVEDVARDVGNNGAQGLVGCDVFPDVDHDEELSARSAIWASHAAPVRVPSGQSTITPEEALNAVLPGRAGILSQVHATLLQCLGRSSDEALALLERRLFALWLAARRLRKQPAECQSEHLVVIDKHGPICARCGERVETEI